MMTPSTMLFYPRKTDPVLKIISGSLTQLPAPMNISMLWNFGSLLGLCLMLQIITGFLLATQFYNSSDCSFESILHTCRDVDYGWMIRMTHATGASLFFICLYSHTGRGVYYGSYKMMHTWFVGVTLLLLTMATAFLGYVLPWGQMSFWGATVITSLLSTVPIIGDGLVQWLWGGFAVGGPTLTRFFSFHFILPFVISALVLIHLLYLHQTGSNNPLGVKDTQSKLPFSPYFTSQDGMGFGPFLVLMLWVLLIDSDLLGDPENYSTANPLSTPPHIQPEWYYLFAYAILRSIPNKLGGVVALVLSIIILYTLPFTSSKNMQSNSSYPMCQLVFWMFTGIVLLLTWIGARPVEDPYILVGQILTCLYFVYFVMDPVLATLQDSSYR